MKMLASLALLPAFVALAACGGPPGRAREKSPDSLAAADASNLVVMDDVAKWGVELIDHREQKLPDGRLRAQIRFRSNSQNDLHLQIAWTFKDDANFAVERETPFEHLMLAAGQTIDLTKESLSNGATRFHVQLKEAKDGKF